MAFLSKVVRLDLVKLQAHGNWHVEVHGTGPESTRVRQARFSSNTSHTFDIDLDSSEEMLLEKIYITDHLTLVDNAEWALGVVTGDNSKYISSSILPGMEPIYRGSDIQKYVLSKPVSYILYEPERFQQVAKNGLYRAPEKLIYRFISNKLIFAYDDTGSITLNSANILVPSMPEISVKSTLALLNSSVLQFVFQKKFATTKVLRGDLELLSFPTCVKAFKVELDQLVDDIRDGKKRHEELDDLAYHCFALTGAEIDMIRKCLGNSNGTT